MEDSHSRLEPAQTGTYSNSFQICCWLSPTPEISVMIVNTNISFFLSLIFHSNLEQTLQLHFLWKVTTISPETMWIDYTSGIRMKHLHVTNFLLEKKKKKVIIMKTQRAICERCTIYVDCVCEQAKYICI